MDGQAVVIDDYLAVRPQARARLDRAVRESRIEVGPWYTLPDEFLVSAETLVRNLQRGLATAQAHGGSLRAGYLPDSFGHASQMPQIYRQFGFRHAVVWRGVPLAIDRLAFTWRAPDGSEILTAYMGTSYSHGVDLPVEPAALASRIQATLKALAPFKPSGDLLLMNGNDHVLPQRRLTTAVKAANRHLNAHELKVAGLQEYLNRLEGSDWPLWSGELRSSARANVLMGTLSVRVPDKQRYFKAGLTLERVAEPLAALATVDASGLLEQAWTFILQNAAHDTACGSGIDAVAEEARLRSAAALQIGEAIVERCLPRIAGAGQAWNPSPFRRRGLVEIEAQVIPSGAQELPDLAQFAPLHLRFPAEEVGRVHSVLDERKITGERVRSVSVTREGAKLRVTAQTSPAGPSADIEAARLEIERLSNQEGVEAIELEIRRDASRRVLVETPWIDGLSVAPLGPDSAVKGDGGVSVRKGWMENEHLRCRLAPDGSLQVEHKASGLVYEGLNRIVDEPDAGDEYNFSPAERQLDGQPPEPLLAPSSIEQGPLRASLSTRFRYQMPAGLDGDRRPTDATVPLNIVTTVSLEKDSCRLDVRMKVDNSARDHRLRALFPLPFEARYSYADTAYHVTRRPVINAHRDPGSPELELPTYPLRSFVDVHAAKGGLALITHGLHEYEVIPGDKPVLALTLLRAVGWLSRDDLRYRTGHAGPPMETPGAQLLGSHDFRYSLLFHTGGWEAGGVWRAAESCLLPLLAGDAAAVSGKPQKIQLEPTAIQMTACLPAGNGYELRLLNASDSPQTAGIEIAPAPAGIDRVALNGELLESVRLDSGKGRLPMRAWEIATLRVQRRGRSEPV